MNIPELAFFWFLFFNSRSSGLDSSLWKHHNLQEARIDFQASSQDCQLFFYCQPLSHTVYRLSGKKEQLQLNVFRGSLLRWFLGVVYHLEVVTEGGSVFSLHLHFTLTLLLAVSRMYSNIVNSYITCKIWSPYTFQDNLNRYSAQIKFQSWLINTNQF